MYGKCLLEILKKHSVNVKKIIDQDCHKWGDFDGGIKCIGLDEICDEKDKALIIVANKAPESIVRELRDGGYKYVTTKQEIDPLLVSSGSQQKFSCEDFLNMDYSKQDIMDLISCFNKIISEICAYYETKL